MLLLLLLLLLLSWNWQNATFRSRCMYMIRDVAVIYSVIQLPTIAR